MRQGASSSYNLINMRLLSRTSSQSGNICLFEFSICLFVFNVLLSMKVRHFFFDPLVLEKFFDGKLRFDEDFQNVEVEVKKNSQKFLGPFSPVELAHWEKGY